MQSTEGTRQGSISHRFVGLRDKRRTLPGYRQAPGGEDDASLAKMLQGILKGSSVDRDRIEPQSAAPGPRSAPPVSLLLSSGDSAGPSHRLVYVE